MAVWIVGSQQEAVPTGARLSQQGDGVLLANRAVTGSGLGLPAGQPVWMPEGMRGRPVTDGVSVAVLTEEGPITGAPVLSH